MPPLPGEHGRMAIFIQGRRTDDPTTQTHDKKRDKTETRSQCMTVPNVLVSRAGNDGSIASNALVPFDGAVDLSIWLAMPEMGSG